MNWSNLLYLQHQLLTPGLATQTQAVKFDADTEEALTTLGEQSADETLPNLPTDLTLPNLPIDLTLPNLSTDLTLPNLPTDLTLSNLPAESLDTVGDSTESEEAAYPLFLRLKN